VITGFFRLVIYGVIAYLIYKFLQAVFAPPAKAARQRPSAEPPGVMVKDEVCGTYLAKEDAIRLSVEGREVYFCSEECRRKFEEQRRRDA
jgi:uncharacterized protein